VSLRLTLIAGAILPLAAAAPAAAQSTANTDAAPTANAPIDPAQLKRDTLTIAIGGGYGPSYIGSDNYVAVPGVVIRGRYKGVSFTTRGTSLQVDVIPSHGGPGWKLDAGPIATLDFNRTGRIDDRQVRALGKRKVAVELGGFAGITRTGVITSDYDSLTARVSYIGDVSDVNHGYIVTPTIEYGTPLSRKAYVGLSGSADYANGGYAHTYFDVPLDRVAASGLRPFSARGGWMDWSVTAIGDLAVKGTLLHGWQLFGSVSYSRLQNDFARSPVTSQAGSPNQLFGAAGVAYTF